MTVLNRDAIGEKLHRMRSRLLQRPASQWRYSHRLAIEEALRDPTAAIDPDEVARRLIEAGRADSGPFNALCFQLYLFTGDTFWRERFSKLAYPLLGDFPVSPEGAWLHPRGRFGAGHAILIDSFQEEACRVVKLAWLARREDMDIPPLFSSEALAQKAVEQFRIHRDILRDAETGLWSNGRGWIEGRPNERSPGFWSRGHGWLLRGLTECLAHLPPGDDRATLAGILRETAASLLPFCRADGLWNAILTAPDGESPVETSGSGMIAAAFLRGVASGDLPAEPFQSAALATAETIFGYHLTEEGVVLNACYGPGPLVSIREWMAPSTFPPDESHGLAAYCMLSATYSK